MDVGGQPFATPALDGGLLVGFHRQDRESIDGFVAHDGTEGLSRCHLERVSVGAETRNQHRIVHLSARR